MPKQTPLEQINARGWANGWHADMLASHAKSQGRTMSDLFGEMIRNANAFNIPAKATKIKGDRVTYQFSDGSTATFLKPNFLRKK